MNKSFSFDPPEKLRIEQLRAELRQHNELYYNKANPEITDQQYDAMLDELRQLELAHPEYNDPASPTQLVGAAPAARSKKETFLPFRHSVPMLSISNTYSANEIRKFIGRVESALRDAGDKDKPGFVVELKIDGLAFTAFYDNGMFVRGATRGDGMMGEDVTPNLKAITSLPKKLAAGHPPGTLEVRGEIYMPAATFARIVAEQEEEGGVRVFANPRNAAAGTLKLLDPATVKARGLETFFYQVVDAGDHGIHGQAEALSKLKKWGLPVNPVRGCFATADEVLRFRDDMDEKRHALPYGTDGLVIKLDSFAQQEILGLGTRSPNWAVAYKFAPEQAETRVAGIRVQVGKLGRLTPVADLDPVNLAGSTITHASLHNESYVAEKDVRIGDTVLVEKAGEIIPQIDQVLKAKRTGKEHPFAMPHNCPSCGVESVTTESSSQDGRKIVLRFCENPACPAKQLARIVHFASRDAMDIEGMGPAVVQWLLDNNMLQDVSGIYSLTAAQLLPMTKAGRDLLTTRKGEATKMADNLVNAIDASKTRGLAKLLFALAIPDIGETAAQLLGKRFKNIDQLRAASEEEIRTAGMGESTAYRTLGDKAARQLADALASATGEKAYGKDAKTLGMFLESLALPGFGKMKAAAVARHFGTVDALLQASAADIAMVEMGASQVKRTLGPVAAHSLHSWLDTPANKALLSRLADAGVVMEDAVQIGSGTGAEGKTFVLTGTLPTLGRSEAKRMIEQAGGLVAASVGNNVDYLVAGENTGGKMAKAVELGVEVIDEARLRILCGK